MERKRPAFDVSKMQYATYRAKEYAEGAIKTAHNIDYDSEKLKRLEKGECKSCYYIMGRMGGAAMTDQPCACCGTMMHFGSTCTDMVCLKCAKDHDLCKHCGGDIDMRVRRRKWPEPTPNGDE